jgi:carbon-monoxide dehydrogenase medium subunit
MMWQHYLQPTSLGEALELLQHHAGTARIVAGGTDVLVELQRGVQPTSTLIDISKLQALKYVRYEDGMLALGALATHNDVIASADAVRYALPLALACREVGAPQIRTRGTVAGNLVTASPANDTITPLMALDAQLVLTNRETERILPLSAFYRGVRRTILQPGELLREIRIPALTTTQRGLFLKLGLRRAQAISVINVAFVLDLDGEQVSQARITLGSVAPTIIHARTAEAYLQGKTLNEQTCREAGKLASLDATPIDDVRASAEYRRSTVSRLVAHGLQQLANSVPSWQPPILLETPGSHASEIAINLHGGLPQLVSQAASFEDVIRTVINGQPYEIVEAEQKTLLNMLREDVGLTGSKEGCAEGECGACTVWLDGQAVMSCLVPAAQAHGAAIATIEGLGCEGQLHPLQQACIEQGAVQCGYCIPGMLMAGAKLLQEQPQPDQEQTREALSGNICRCTGYRKILAAVAQAGGSL